MMRGHNMVADGWVGASNPQPYPNHTPKPPPTHSHTNNRPTKCSFINARFPRFQVERDNSSVTNGLTDRRTNGPTDRQSLLWSCVSSSKKKRKKKKKKKKEKEKEKKEKVRERERERERDRERER